MINWPSSVYEASWSEMVHLRKVIGKCKYVIDFIYFFLTGKVVPTSAEVAYLVKQMFIIPIQELDEIVNGHFGSGDVQTQSTNDEVELQEQPGQIM